MDPACPPLPFGAWGKDDFFQREARKRDVDHWAHARNGSGDQGCREAADATDPP